MASLAAPNQLTFTKEVPEPCRIRNQAGLLNLFFEVRRLTRNKDRFCWATNKYLAGYLKCSVDTVERYIARLVALGALAVEQVIGIERRIRVLLSPESLKALLFPGHKTHWRESAPDLRPSATTARFSAPKVPKTRHENAAKTTPESLENHTGAPSFCPLVAEGSAETVAEGQYKVSRRDTLQTPAKQEGQQSAQGLYPNPKTSQSTESLAAASLLAESAGIPLPVAQSIAHDPQVRSATKDLSRATIEHILSCFHAAKARGRVQNAGGWLRAALRSPEGYSAPVAPASHPSEISRAPRHTPAKARITPHPCPAVSTEPSAWELLGEVRQQDFLEAALAEMVQSETPFYREQARKKGTRSHLVISRAKTLALSVGSQ